MSDAAATPAAPTAEAPTMAGTEGSRFGAAFWVGMVLGAALVAFGAKNLVEVQRPRLPSIGRWSLGSALLLDLLLVPVGAAVGIVARRVVPRLAWPPVRAALLASAVLIGFTLPLLLDKGGVPDNASLRPRPYGSGLAWALVAVWLVAALVAVARLRGGHRSGAVDAS